MKQLLVSDLQSQQKNRRKEFQSWKSRSTKTYLDVA